MIISKIEVQKKNPKRVSIFIDEQFAFGLDMQDCLELKLKEGKKLSQEDLDFIKNEVLTKRALDLSFRYLSYSDRSEKQIKDYLFDKDIPFDVISITIEKLKSYNYIDDLNYAIKYISSRKAKGSIAMQLELRDKGIDIKTVDEAIELADMDEYANSYAILEKRYDRFQDFDEKLKNRAFNYLSNRGFSREIIFDVIKKYETNRNNND